MLVFGFGDDGDGDSDVTVSGVHVADPLDGDKGINKGIR